VLLGVPLGTRLLLALDGLTQYLRLSIWPSPLLNEYDELTTVSSLLTLLPALLLLLFTAWCIFRKSPRPRFLVLWFLLPLLPVLNVAAATGETLAERFLCLPLAALGYALAWSLTAADRRLSLVQRNVVSALLVGVLLSSGLLSYWRAKDYESESTMMAALVRDAPDSSGAYRLSAGLHRRNRQFARLQRDEQRVEQETAATLKHLRTAVLKNERDALSRLELVRFLLELITDDQTPNQQMFLVEAMRHATWLVESDGLRAESHLLDGMARS
jgi:hypothetical protein